MLLSSIYAAGIITAGVLVPKVTAMLLEVSERRKERVVGSLQRLKQAGLIEYKDNGIRLTRRGEAFVHKVTGPIRPKKWDGKWRVVIFDIAENRRVKRLRLRSALKELGFYRLQNSVWVHPFDCEDLVTLLKTDFKLGKEVIYMITEHIENDAALLRHFALKRN